MLGTLTAFSEELRQAGLPISPIETLDACRAVEQLVLPAPPVLRAALAASMVKDAAHRAAFDTVFDVFFAGGRRRPAEPDAAGELDGPFVTFGEAAGARDESAEAATGLDPEALAALVRRALLSGDPAELDRLARLAVARFAALEPGRPVGLSYYLFRVLRAIDLQGTLSGLLDQLRSGPALCEPAPAGLDGLDRLDRLDDALGRRLAAEEIEHAAEALRSSISAELVRRLAEERGSAAVASSLRRALVEDVDFMHASREELAAMRRSLQPIARVLASRLARRRRRSRRGPLDFRATIRRSLSTGGVPVSPRFRSPRRAKPELVVLADVSGSVAAFARFTLHLVYALSSQFSAVRTFAFVDGMDEVSRIFSASSSIVEATGRVEREAKVTEADGHSDYGAAFGRFNVRYLQAVTPRSTVLVLGDGRGNYHPARPELLAEIARRARHLYWLNPEPRTYWGSGDSIVAQYEPFCEAMVECRNLRQLEGFVDSLD